MLVMYMYLTDDFSQHLLKYMDADQLPKYLGGTLTDPDGNPRCLTMVSSKIYPKIMHLFQVPINWPSVS